MKTKTTSKIIKPVMPAYPKSPIAVTILSMNRFLSRYLEALRAANSAKT